MKRIYLIIVYMVLYLFGTAFAQMSSHEAFSRMLQLREQGKVPAYVVERGTYKYFDNIRAAYVKGKNVFMRSQPQKVARIITKLSNVELEYLGEWTHPTNGEKWICVKRKTYNEIGWIYGQYIELLKETSSKGHKKNKDCTEDPCGFLGGLLLISPIFYFVGKFSKGGKQKNSSDEIGTALDISFIKDEVKEKCCPHYDRTSCSGCWKLSGEHPFSNVLYTKCNHFGKYVHTSRTPQYNANHLESFDDECCPFYDKYHCEDCPRMDSNDEYYGYYKCSHFHAYVKPDESPQYNSDNLKYR